MFLNPNLLRQENQFASLLDFLRHFAIARTGERFGLGEDIRDQHIVVPARQIERPGESDEVAWD